MRGHRLTNPLSLLFFVGSLAALAAPSEAQTVPGSEGVKVDLELLLGVDVSGSVDELEAELQRAGYIAAFRDPAIHRVIAGGRQGRIAVAYVEWAGSFYKRVVADWTVIDGADAAEAFAGHLESVPIERGPRTSLSGIIDYAVPRFAENAFDGFRRVLDISGDGPNNNGRGIKEARDEAVAAGITINGLPIVNDRPSRWGRPPMRNLDLYYEACVIGGFGSFYVVAEGFESFAQAIRKKLILEIAGLTPGEPGLRAAPPPLRNDRAVRALPAAWRPRPIGGEGVAAPLHHHLASAGDRPVPPCDIGERIFEQRMRDSDF